MTAPTILNVTVTCSGSFIYFICYYRLWIFPL